MTDYRLTITQEITVTEQELNKLYDTLENTQQRILLVYDITNNVHLLDWAYVKSCSWSEHNQAVMRPSTLPEEKVS